MEPLCGPCKHGDHSSHDPTPEVMARCLATELKWHSPYSTVWELTDCKTGTLPNFQCCCEVPRAAALRAIGLDEDGNPLSP